ncbi:sensor histidine kinase [Foetidibacter luteolus]|uniref:sensor histidine kinase n=1 Tax=Foetidibacter luteolus TaxID=2608880 RepID=UPI00129C097E|nr:histidine kinase [Foetidibacter luteolus]
MGKKEVRGFLWLLTGWMLFIFFLMTPEVFFVNPGYLATKTFAVQYGVFGLINFVMFYIASFFITPRYFRPKKYLRFVWACIGMIFFFGVFKYFVGYLFGDIVLKQFRMLEKNEFSVAVHFFIVTIRNSGLCLLMGVAHRSFFDWIASEKKKRELETQKHAAEMAFLKMQVNPHFLFNALNNLFSLATIERSSKTADGIMKLSHMIRYMLYEKEDSNNRVSLQKEVDFLNSFIDLVKLRYDGGININFSIEGNITHQRIPALLLFPLLENACKHGILDDPLKPVNIELAITGTQLKFTVNNYINSYLKDKTGGIGLENVKKRLELMYPGKHSIDIENSGGQFFVTIKLPL